MSVDYRTKIIFGYEITGEKAEIFNEQTNWMYEEYVHHANAYGVGSIILGVELFSVCAGGARPLYSDEGTAPTGAEEYDALRYIGEFMRKIDPDARIKTYVMCQID